MSLTVSRQETQLTKEAQLKIPEASTAHLLVADGILGYVERRRNLPSKAVAFEIRQPDSLGWGTSCAAAQQCAALKER